jgi:hypothetical protein
MERLFHDSPACERPGGNAAARRGARARLAILALLGCLALGGCNRGGIPGLVSVRGKLTYAGGAWPNKGEIIFSQTNKVGTGPVLPAMAHINDDGTFEVQTSDAMGMMPGEYAAIIRCWLDAPGEGGRKGKSAIPQRFGSPQTSGLTVTVPENSGPITLTWDIPSK